MVERRQTMGWLGGNVCPVGAAVGAAPGSRSAAIAAPARMALVCLALSAATPAAGCSGGGEEGTTDESQGAAETDPLQGGRQTTRPPTDTEDPGAPDELPGVADPDAEALQPGLAADGAGSAGALPTYRITAGTRIRVTVDDEISTEIYLPGDAVVATVSEAVVDPAGRELIPAGAKLLGRILSARGSQGVGEDAVIEMYFETLSALNGEWPVEGAVVSAPVTLDPQGELRRRFSRDRSGGDDEVAGEIAAGAVVEVELRAPVRVTPMVVPADSLRDTVPRPDTVTGMGGAGGPTSPA